MKYLLEIDRTTFYKGIYCMVLPARITQRQAKSCAESILKSYTESFDYTERPSCLVIKRYKRKGHGKMIGMFYYCSSSMKYYFSEIVKG